MICILFGKIYRSLFTHVRSKIDARASNVSRRCRHRYIIYTYYRQVPDIIVCSTRAAADIVLCITCLSCYIFAINDLLYNVTPLARDAKYDRSQSKPSSREWLSKVTNRKIILFHYDQYNTYCPTKLWQGGTWLPCQNYSSSVGRVYLLNTFIIIRRWWENILLCPAMYTSVGSHYNNNIVTLKYWTKYDL